MRGAVIPVDEFGAFVRVMGFGGARAVDGVRVDGVYMDGGVVARVYTNDPRLARYCHSLDQLAYEVGAMSARGRA